MNGSEYSSDVFHRAGNCSFAGDPEAPILLYFPAPREDKSEGPEGEGWIHTLSAAVAERILKESPRPIRIMVAHAPETEMADAVREATRKTKIFLNLSCHRAGAVVTKRKGLTRLSVCVEGTSAPSSQPLLGNNALSRAAELIHKFSTASRQQCIGPYSVCWGLTCADAPDGTSPASCRFTADLSRENERQIRKIDDAFRSAVETDLVYETRAAVTEKATLPVFFPDDADFALFDFLRDTEYRRTGIVPAPEMSRLPGVTGIASENGAICLDGLGEDGNEEAAIARILGLLRALPQNLSLTRSPLRFYAPLTDRCVLQRDRRIPVRGYGVPDTTVTVTLDGQTQTASVTADGTWCVFFPPRPASVQPTVITASDGTNSIFISDVLFGDVWVLTGQSNMEHSLGHNPQVNARNRGARQNASPDFPVRFLVQRRIDSVEDPDSMVAPQRWFRDETRSAWRIPSETTLEECSTIGWFFADRICRALDQKVPVGLLSVSAGSSALTHLMPLPAAASELYTRDANDENRSVPPAGIYHTMTSPLKGTPAKGILFYQGESDQVRWDTFDRMTAGFVEQARRDFGENIPFYFVQISSHPVWSHIHDIREVQIRALDLIPNSGIVVSRDLGWKTGDMEVAHPNYKRELGLRMADLALARDYGIGSEETVTAPLPKKADFSADGVTVTFAPVADGLTCADTPVGFELLIGGKWISAPAKITGKDTVFVSGDAPEAVRFAHFNQAGTDVADLCSSTGMQVPSFRLDKAPIQNRTPDTAH